MSLLDTALSDLHSLDELAGGDSVVHRLDPRAKVSATGLFLLAVASFDRYAVSPLLPFAFFPVLLAALAGLPWGLLLRRLLWASPLVLGVGLAGLLFDREVLLRLGPWEMPAGWVALASLLLRLVLTLLTALVLVATTGVPGLCRALERLGAPRLFTTQLLFLHRYLFLLGAELRRLLRAWSLRAPGRSRTELKTFALLAGQLLLRTLERAHRVHRALLARGFEGRIPGPGLRPLRRADIAFTLGCGGAFLLLRLVNLPTWFGGLLLGGPP